MIFPGLQILPQTLSFLRFQNQFSLRSTYISYDVNSDKFTEIPTLPIWCLTSHSPDFYQILPIYHKILKTRGKLLIFRIFGDLSLWNTHIILTFFAKSIMVCYNSGRNDVKIQEMALERT